MQVINNVAQRLALFLSNLNALLFTLVFYIVIALMTYFILKLTLGSGHSEAFITYEICTGGDPFNYASTFATHQWVWSWLLILHVISWLIVPVLAATAVDVVFSVREKRKFALDDEIENAMIQALIKHTSLSSSDAIAFAKLWKQKISNRLD